MTNEYSERVGDSRYDDFLRTRRHPDLFVSPNKNQKLVDETAVRLSQSMGTTRTSVRKTIHLIHVY